MPKKRPSLRKDENETAYGIVQAMIGEGPRPEPPGKREKNPEAVARGNAYSKKLANHLYDVALHVMWVNYCRPSQALSKGRNKVTPAMAAGRADRVWMAEDILGLLESTGG